MIILGIESSCDETGISVFCTEKNIVIANVINSQVNLHSKYGGVVPELASRDHMINIIPTIKESLKIANIKITDIDLIAYTVGPGLSGALMVGSTIANSIAWALDIPIIKINHLEGHILSPLLDCSIKFPFISLLVSGGNTQLILAKKIGEYVILGDTLDDAAGEAFDKTAKLMGLSYPGGPEIAKLAKFGDSKKYILPKPLLKSNNLDFSFSGLKTAVSLKINSLKLKKEWNLQVISDLSASIQETIIDILIFKSLKSLKLTKISNLLVSGGVSVNQLLRSKLSKEVIKIGGNVFFPPTELCTDNGAMIAFAAALRLKHNMLDISLQKNYDLSINTKFNIEDINY
ncbi:tRNA N6-adenosine threonylcarbamoyltransferase [Candidatus Kinetoplastibacterium sorsogonicusi]|uniref:tRNA N6-adenosine threonylcarbamoyltransferase n=1 Tax=Candidatus Kinetoplastidibacterium kentomonadis TaxID=1576550 RepID=A0A3Q8ER79_9PROT|nr:tRNA (adenosine(37)-N6)-threonylcarbamoyltransferase complex transferase subunit TsaD [Candidatus Kinetoplastibacterium sorsogonicusi]AWD32374.1 tRNA N6-adenosine threonylcarbamoyltransferase [Candidatus Kinetoplastibacterium sorsogonicusi]